MAKRIVTKIGNIFCVDIGGKYKRFFQYIANDMSQLNSSVIRIFKKRYSFEHSIKIDEIISDDIEFYAHTMLRIGIEDGVCYKVGTSKEMGIDKLKEVTFATASSFKAFDITNIMEVNPLDNWHIWHINEEHRFIGRMPEYLSEIVEPGSVMPCSMIRDKMEYGYYIETSAMYDAIKRRPYDDVDSYTKQMVCGNGSYFHFKGEDAVAQLVVRNGVRTKLYLEIPVANGHRLREEKFWETNWHSYDFITKEEFEAAWNVE